MIYISPAGFVGFVLELFIAVFTPVVITAVLTAIVKLFTKKTYKEILKKTKWVAIVLILLGFVSVIIRSYRDILQTPIEFRKETLGPVQDARFKKIIKKVVQGDKSYLVEEIRTEFRELYKKLGISGKKFQKEKDLMIYTTQKYQYLFWNDALQALKQGKLIETEERLIFERTKVRKGQFSRSRIASSKEMLQKISRKMPVKIGGQEVVLDEALINATLDNIKGAIQRIEWLYSE